MRWWWWIVCYESLISEGQHFRVRYVKPWTFSLLVCCHRILRVFSLDGSQFNAISKYYLVYGHSGNPTLNHSLGGVVGIHSSHSPQKTGTKPEPSSRSIWRIILVIHHLLLKVYSSDISSNRSNDRCCVGCSSKQPPSRFLLTVSEVGWLATSASASQIIAEFTLSIWITINEHLSMQLLYSDFVKQSHHI